MEHLLDARPKPLAASVPPEEQQSPVWGPRPTAAPSRTFLPQAPTSLTPDLPHPLHRLFPGTRTPFPARRPGCSPRLAPAQWRCRTPLPAPCSPGMGSAHVVHPLAPGAHAGGTLALFSLSGCPGPRRLPGPLGQLLRQRPQEFTQRRGQWVPQGPGGGGCRRHPSSQRVGVQENVAVSRQQPRWRKAEPG